MMNIHHAPLFLIAEVATNTSATLSPWLTLGNYGVLGIWLWYMIARDKKESEKQDKRHEDNLEAQKKVEEAFKTCITSITIAVEGMKSMDRAYAELAAKLNSQK